MRIEPMHFPLNYVINWWNQLLVIKMTDEFLPSLTLFFCRPFFIVQWHFGPDHVQLTKVNWRLKVNWKNFQEFFCKIFPIDFVVVNHVLWVNSIENVKSQLQTSKVNCKLQISNTILRTNSYFCLFLLLISRKRKRNLNYEFVESYKP